MVDDHEDYQPGEAPASHKTTHQDGGSDEISVAGLSGETAALAAHKILPAIHHLRYTDVEAAAAAAALILIHKADAVAHQDAPQLILDHKGDAVAHQDAPQLILDHKGDAVAHHAKYTDVEARAAINNIFGADGKADVHIDLDTHKLINVVDPTNDQDAVTNKYLLDLAAAHVGTADAHHAKYTDGEARTAVYGSLPAFHSYVSPSQLNVTGDATVYSIIGAIWTEIKDNLGNFSNGIFTAPIAGLYLFSVDLWLTGVGAAHTTGQFEFVTSNRAYTVSYQNYANLQSGGNIFIPFSIITDMDVDDTAFLRLTVFSGAITVDVIETTYFSGVLVLR